VSGLAQALAELVGARIDGAHLSPGTGLVVLALHGELGRRLLGVGIGPRVSGVGVLPRSPRARGPASHPLVLAMRAHLVGHCVVSLRAEDGLVVLETDDGARLELAPGRRGHAFVSGADVVVRWGVFPGAATAPSIEPLLDLEASGAALLAESDRIALERERVVLARAIARRAAATRRRIAAIEGDLARVATIPELQRTGRLLLAQGARVPRGVARAVLDDWEAGGTLEVELDPARGAKEQAEAFFAKARRYQRGAGIIRRRLDEARKALRALEELRAALGGDTDVAELGTIEKRARALGVSLTEAALPVGSGRAPKPAERLPFTRYRGAGGREIRVGRGAADNDALTTRHARPGDLWLHAKGRTGAHVVVPLERGSSCPAELLVDAATLAAHFSDARGDGVCEVSYVARRYVRKRRGSAPGEVTLDREKVIPVRLESARLQRLLATKDDQKVP